MRIQLRSLALGLALSAAIGAARADVIVSGVLQDLRVEADQAPIAEVLEALKQRFGIVYQSRARLDWTVDGVFYGPLSSVLPRILRDKDYAFQIAADNSVIIFVVSPHGLTPEAPIPPPVKAVVMGPTPVSDTSQKPAAFNCRQARPAIAQGAAGQAWLGALARATR